MSDSTVGQTKQFGKGQRVVPAQKAQKWYPVDDESQPKKVSTPCLLQEFWFGLYWRNKKMRFSVDECEDCAGQNEHLNSVVQCGPGRCR